MNCYNKKTICIFAIVFLSGCVSSPRFAGRNSRIIRTSQQAGQTEKIPSGKILLTLEGVASYYAHDFHGRQTSNGEIYDMNGLTAAHRNFPFGTIVRVTNLENNKTVIVRINDRGPFKEGRIMDLSLGAAKEIDLIVNGTARVRLEVLEWGNGK